MELNEIYAPVEKDLVKVEEKLNEISKVDFSHLAELVDYSLKNTGKMIRPALTLLTGKFYRYNLDLLLNMATSVEVMHTATLVHDDAIDHSAMRRGRSTIYKLWGDEQAVLLGDYLFAEAGGLCAATDNLRVIRQFSATLKTISSGEIDQAYNSFNPQQSREKYFSRIAKKTAALFSLSTESGAVLSDAPEESIQILANYGYNLGVAFQIVDDILDFTSTEDELGKPVGSDLSQGTITLPSLMIMEKYPGDNPIITLFENKNGQAEIDRAIEIVKNSTIIDECYEIADDYCRKACRDIKKLPECQTRTCLEELASYMTIRKK
ncbi:MAG: polyprenyl synthetase family protein [Dehalococcoidales bacterium]|nr:MAG: polyprenyl synthetase family protein [Dehalococcoidales bacterium]